LRYAVCEHYVDSFPRAVSLFLDYFDVVEFADFQSVLAVCIFAEWLRLIFGVVM
jgi:hypothetical protein